MARPYGVVNSVILAVATIGLGCTPRVAIEAPTEPITINMNVKIEHEITIRVDKDLDDLLLDDELFGEDE
jgi:hypothetical protein